MSENEEVVEESATKRLKVGDDDEQVGDDDEQVVLASGGEYFLPPDHPQFGVVKAKTLKNGAPFRLRHVIDAIQTPFRGEMKISLSVFL